MFFSFPTVANNSFLLINPPWQYPGSSAWSPPHCLELLGWLHVIASVLTCKDPLCEHMLSVYHLIDVKNCMHKLKLHPYKVFVHWWLH